MAREDDLLRTFVEVADNLVDDFDLVDMLHRLASRCVSVLEVSEAGIMLADPKGTLQYLASSSDRMRLIELLELQHAEGPCLDAFRSARAVLCPDVEAARDRWPHFVPRVRDAGFHSVAAIPMRWHTDIIGVLNLFSTNANPLSDRDQTVAQALADISTISILQARAIRSGRELTAQLQSALDSRVVIEQAKGILAEHISVSVDDAFEVLRRFARGHNQRIGAVARRVVDRSLTPEDVVG